MRKRSAKMTVLFVLVFFVVQIRGHAQIIYRSHSIDRLDPSLNVIVSFTARLEKLADSPGPGTREGPVWDFKAGYLLFSDMGAKAVDKWDPRDGRVSVYQKNTDSDGLALDPQDRLVWAARTPAGGEIARLENDGSRTVLVTDTPNLPVKRPNDLVYKSDGALYFTDTAPTNRRVYLFKDRKLILLTKDLPYPNGLAFSPGEKYLYINDSEKRIITRFDVQHEDRISHPKLIIDMARGQEPCPFPCAAGYPDGMKVDQKGNIYSTGPGGIWVVTPDGKHLGTILVPDHPANLAFGGADGKTLFITCRPGLYRIRLKVAGAGIGR